MTRLAISLGLFSACVAICLRSPSAADQKTEGPPDLAPLVKLLLEVEDEAVRLDVIKGMRAGLKGRKKVPMPDGWAKLSPKLAKAKSADLRREAELLGLTFGDPVVFTALRKEIKNAKVAAPRRREAMQSLIAHGAKIETDLLSLIDDKAVRTTVIVGLASYSGDRIPGALLSRMKQFSIEDRQKAVGTLASRTAWAGKLLDAVEKKIIARNDVSAFHARQIQTLGNKKLTERLADVWGEIRVTSAERKKLIAKYKRLLPGKFLAKANLSNGRLVYKKTCQKCHVLFGEGGKVGPGLTGSNRANLDYVLENILDPSALIGKDYQMVIVRTNGARVINGIISERTTKSMTLRTADGEVVVPTDDISRLRISDVSMMPEGQLKTLTRNQIRDLVAYLASPKQVPLPKP